MFRYANPECQLEFIAYNGQAAITVKTKLIQMLLSDCVRRHRNRAAQVVPTTHRSILPNLGLRYTQAGPTDLPGRKGNAYCSDLS